MFDWSNDVGILLVGHGTRSELGTRQYLALAASLAHRLAPLHLEPSFLELTQPDLDAAIGRLMDLGVKRLVTMPLLLFAAGHTKRDIPKQVREALDRRGGDDIHFVQTAHIGCHPAIVELSQRRMVNALVPRRDPGTADGRGHSRPYTECLLLVGRGSRDESATAEMHEFARLRQLAGGGITTEIAFLAMARPLLHEQLAQVSGRGYRRVIVQPHLLFCGELLNSLKRQVSEVGGRCPNQEWIVVPPLADEPNTISQETDFLCDVIVDRLAEAGIHVVAAARGD
jgi:sirohydrochlorin cobaltochelatase